MTYNIPLQPLLELDDGEAQSDQLASHVKP